MITNIGKHRVRCGDVMENLDELFNGEKADIFYSDPPWANLKYWTTLNQKMNNVTNKTAELYEFLNRIFEVINLYVKEEGIIFIEYGIKWNNDLIHIAEEKGLKLIKTIELVYGSPERPSMINIFTKGKELDIPEEYIKSVYHTKAMAVLENAITPFAKEGDIITDVCCGMGYTAQYAVNHNLRFLGNELNQARLDKTIKRLMKSEKTK